MMNKSMSLTAQIRGWGCSNGAGCGRMWLEKVGTFETLNPTYASQQGLHAPPFTEANILILRKLLPGKCSEIGPCFRPETGSLSERQQARVVYPESLLQMLQLWSVPPCFKPTQCWMIGGQSGYIMISGRNLQLGQ